MSKRNHSQYFIDFQAILEMGYWTRVNFRLKPILVFDVGYVFATKGSVIE